MITASELKTVMDGAEASGENCEYDALYTDLDDLAVSDEELGKEADFRQLEKNCLELWKKTRDLRVAAYLCVAETELNGFEGFAEGLDVIRWLISDMWDGFYPRLDPDDDNDPLERLNIMAMLSPQPGAFNDPIMFQVARDPVDAGIAVHNARRDDFERGNRKRDAGRRQADRRRNDESAG